MKIEYRNFKTVCFERGSAEAIVKYQFVRPRDMAYWPNSTSLMTDIEALFKRYFYNSRIGEEYPEIKFMVASARLNERTPAVAVNISMKNVEANSRDLMRLHILICRVMDKYNIDRYGGAS